MPTTRDNSGASRFEILDDAGDGEVVAGFVEYQLGDGLVTFTHTETDPAFAGRGLAKQLVTAALDDARRRGLAVVPVCPYVRKVIVDAAADYLDLVPAGERARFDLPAS